MESHEKAEDAPLREEDVTRGDKLDDRVAEGEGLPAESDDDEQE